MGLSSIPNSVITLDDNGVFNQSNPDNTQGVVRADESGIVIGAAGTPVSQILVISQLLTPSSVVAETVAAQSFTVTGLFTTDKVFVNGPAPSNSSYMSAARVSATNTLSLIFVNPTVGALTPVSGTYVIVAIRS